jgi:N-acetyl-anhydromuramyl-L-alanine amidase AmpD
MIRKKIDFDKKHYYDEDVVKKQIYLHHTAGNSSGESVFQWWAQTPDRVATFCAISGDGTVVQGFEPSKWAYHLGIGTKHFGEHKLKYTNLDKVSIGIEICNWGQLTPDGTKFSTYTKRQIPSSEIIKLDQPFKGYQYWHNYTDAQIDALEELLCDLQGRFQIPLAVSGDLFSINKKAFLGEPGLYTHNSVRKDKTDIYPHPKLIEMLNRFS